MSYCNFYIPTNATVIPVDSRFTSQKVVLLPDAATVPGKILTIKDQYGTARISSFTISTIGNNTIDSYTNNYRFTSTLQSVTLFSDGVNNWRSLYYLSGLNNLQSPFSPSSISSLALWVDASDPWNRGPFSTVVQTPISIWYDKSGGRRNLIVSSITGSLNRPSTVFISTFPGTLNWAVQMRRTMCYCANPVFFSSGNTGTTCFMVFQGGGDGGSTVFRTGNPTIQRRLARDTTVSYNLFYGTEGGYYNTQGSNTGANFATMTSVFSPSTQRSYYKFNGSAVGTGFNFRLSTLQGTTQFYVGGTPSEGVGSTAFIGNINEMLYYNSDLPSSQVQVVEGYLAWKWGMQNWLNINHPYRFITPSSYDVTNPT